MGGLVFASILVASGVLFSCGGKEYRLNSTARSPATTGSVEAKKVEGGNTFVQLELDHLPPPERLDDGLTTYVVWFEGRGAGPVRAGQLSIDRDKRKGKLEATTPLEQFEVKVTAEYDPEAAVPSDIVIARAMVDAK